MAILSRVEASRQETIGKDVQERFVKVNILVKDFHSQRLAYSMIHRHGVVRGSACDHPLHRVEGGHGIVQFSVIVSWGKMQRLRRGGTQGNPNVAVRLDVVIQAATAMATTMITRRSSLEAIRVSTLGVVKMERLS